MEAAEEMAQISGFLRTFAVSADWKFSWKTIGAR
jgi:hypothetical protein